MKLPHHGRYGHSALPQRPRSSWPNGTNLALVLCNNINGQDQLDSFGEAIQQAALADILLLTKTDLDQSGAFATKPYQSAN
jgi:hypothetical protein